MELRSRALTLRFVALVSVICCLVPVAMAQQVGATLTGTVMDSTQAVIPGATVVVQNAASGDTRRSTSNAEGYFTIVALPPGTYTVTIESQGFSKWENKGVVLNPGDKRNLSDIQLKPGATNEVIEVTGAVEQITPVDSGEKAAVIGQKQLQNIAIVGRNAAEFIKILPGMANNANGGVNRAAYDGQTQGTGSGPIGSYSAQGQRSGALDITADGAHIIDPGCNCGQAVNTNTEMMQEIKVLTSNFGAENQKGPVVISAVGKSGGRDFHGEAYMYARHNSMNANDWLGNTAGHGADGNPVSPRPETKYWYPGGNIGGPVIIPGTDFNKNRDKMFFHVSYELYKQTVDNGIYRAFVPTQEMRQGVFNQAYLDGYRGDSYIGYSIQNAPKAEFMGADGKIKPNLIDPRGQTMMSLYPMPNVDPKTNGGMNYIANFTRQADMWQLRPRVDYSFSDNLKLYVTYNRQRDSGQSALDTLWWRPEPTVPYPTANIQKNESHSLSVNLTKVFNPTLTNELVFTYTYLNLPNYYEDPDKIDRNKLGITYDNVFDHSTAYIPYMTGWSNGIANMINEGGYELTGAKYAKKIMPTVANNVAKVWGTHTSKFGAYWEQVTNDQPQGGIINGQMEFADWVSGSSGNAYADMIMGGPFNYAEVNYNTIMRMHYDVLDFYAQDSWKVNRRLTLDYGVRFNHLSPWKDEGGTGFAVWDPASYSNDPADVKKMTGILWNARDSSVPLSGSKPQSLFINPRFGFAFDVFGTGKTVLRGGFGMYRWHDEQNVQAGSLGITRGTYQYNLPRSVKFDDIGTFAGEFAPPSNPQLLDRNDDEQPRTMSYSFTISQRMPWSSLFEVAYVGNKSDYLSNYNNNFNKLNYLPMGTLLDPDIWEVDLQNVDSYRPLKNYGKDLKQITHEMYSNYNSMQASWNKQSGRLTWMANYTFSKSLGIRGSDGSVAGDPTTLANNYGVLGADRTHIFNVAYVFETPKLSTTNKLVSGMFNGWQISGISQIQSGVNLQSVFDSNFNLSGYLPAGTLLPNGEVATEQISISNTRMLGTPDIDLQPMLTCDPRNGLKSGQYANGSCFTVPTQFGTNGVFNFPYLRGPAFMNHDLSVFKNFEMGEGKRLQLRASAYNFLNHPLDTFLANDPNLTLAFNERNELTRTDFGKTTNKTGHRIMQLAIKYTF